MKKFHHSVFVSGLAAIAAAGFLVGCGSETEQSTETSSTVSTLPATTPSAVPPPTTSVSPGISGQDPEQTAPSPTGGASAGGGSADGGDSSGPSQTVSGGISAAPPPVNDGATAPTGDNLPGENAGPQGRPGTPGDDN
jgi:hypothetical protein